MKKFNKLVSACLAVLLLMAVVPFSAGALSQEYIYIGLQVADEAFSGDINDMDTIDLELDAVAPLNEQEVILDELDLEGAVITGWKLWGFYHREADGNAFCKELDTLAADFSFSEYTDEKYEEYCNDYTELFIEPVIDRKYWFEEEPTAHYPYAKTNKTAESVQWYKYEPKVVTKEVVEEVTDSAAQVKYDTLWQGSYNAEGYWESSENADPNDPTTVDEYIIDMSVKLKEGETVEITLSDGFDGAVHMYFDIEVFTKNGNVYTYTAQYDEQFNFFIHEATVPFTAEISMDVIDYDITAISGQDKALYTGEGNQLVACHASFESGEYVIKTDMVELGDCWIVKQPTKEDPTVETNKAADGYQWYTYEEVIKNYIYVDEVNDSTKELAFEEIDLSTSVPMSDFIGKNVLLSGEYSGDGWWKVSEGQYGFNGYDFDPDVPCFFGGVFDFRKGDKFKVEIAGSASSDPEAPDYELDIYAESQTELWYEDDFEKDADGNYIVPDDAALLSISVITYNPDIKVKVTRITTEAILEAVLGQTDKTFTGDEGTYVVKATMDDDIVLTSLPVDVEKKSVDGGNNNNNNNNNGGTPDTGDTTNITLWIVIAMLSAAAFVGSCYMRKSAK